MYSGSADVVLRENTEYYVWFFPNSKKHGWAFWHNNDSYRTEYELSGTSKFVLSTSEGDGSSIAVSRTSSAVATTGDLVDGDTIYTDDTLKISFAPDDNYAITTSTVNGVPFISGNTHTVTSDVIVASTAMPQKSLIAATDANVGSTSMITVTRYNSAYTHTIEYSFAGASDVICEMSDQTSIAWTVPTSFYEKIPNDSAETCTLTITTYDGQTSLGSNTCTMTVTVSASEPHVTGTVIDINSQTVELTGDPSVLIRYKSTALCTLTATPQNFASIATVKIMGNEEHGEVMDGATIATKTIENAAESTYIFSATDSRGYTTSVVQTPMVIPYTMLTCNPTVSRPTPTGNEIKLSVSGNIYRGSFGVADNQLTLQYRYKLATDAAYGNWKSINSSYITYGTSNYEVSELTLPDEFDYKLNYTFQIQAIDGAYGEALTTVSKTLTIQKGLPVFDWGEEDFAFHVPVDVDGNKICNVADPEESGDGVNKAYVDQVAVELSEKAEESADAAKNSANTYTDTSVAASLLTAKETSHAAVNTNLAVARLSSDSLSGTTTVTVAGGWSAGYRLYMILLTIADDNTPMVQLLVPRELVADNASGQIWSVSTTESSKEMRVYHNGEDLIVTTTGSTNHGGGRTAYIYGLFPEQVITEESEG